MCNLLDTVDSKSCDYYIWANFDITFARSFYMYEDDGISLLPVRDRHVENART